MIRQLPQMKDLLIQNRASIATGPSQGFEDADSSLFQHPFSNTFPTDEVSLHKKLNWIFTCFALGSMMVTNIATSGCGNCSQQVETKAESTATTPNKTPNKNTTTPDISHSMKHPKGSSQPNNVRASALAGSWYPRSPVELRSSIDGLLNQVKKTETRTPMAMIVPHAGHSWSGAIAADAYALIKGKSYRRVFILAPNHTAPLIGAAVPSATHFATPLGEVPIDTKVTQALAKLQGFVMDDRPHAREHAIEIQLPFLQVALKPGYHIVPIIVGEIESNEAEDLAEKLRPLVNSDDLVIVSSDFTHYGARFGYLPFKDNVFQNLEKLDLGAFEQIKKRSLEGFEKYKQKTDISVCGYHPILVLLALLPKSSEVTLLRYETSGKMTNDVSNSVSYLSIAISGPGWTEAAVAHLDLPHVVAVGGPEVLSPVEQQIALKIARAAVEKYVRQGQTLQPEELGIQVSETFKQQYGVFVTLKKNDILRGCIGNIWPVSPLINGLIGRAADAAAHDRRFPPVQPEELQHLEVEVSILTQPSKVTSFQEIEIGRHGIVVNKHGKSAVYLPQVAPEQGWSLEETLSHLSIKAGLPSDAWRSGTSFEVFEAQVFKEE